jgi:hypothetical protein
MQASQIIKARRDFICINNNDPNEVIYLKRQFPKITISEIKETMNKFGPLRDNIVAQLERKNIFP